MHSGEGSLSTAALSNLLNISKLGIPKSIIFSPFFANHHCLYNLLVLLDPNKIHNLFIYNFYKLIFAELELKKECRENVSTSFKIPQKRKENHAKLKHKIPLFLALTLLHQQHMLVQNNFFMSTN